MHYRNKLLQWYTESFQLQLFCFSFSTDILFGKRCGFKTLLVLTGITTKNDVDALNAPNLNSKDSVVPDYYADQLGDILKMIASSWFFQD